jgi:putative flippase GtrA
MPLAFLRRKPLRFLFAGGINTVIGYFIGVYTYFVLIDIASVWAIGTVANLISITCAFILHKFFTYESKGLWIGEYLKFLIAYTGIGLFSTATLWLMLDLFNLTIWIAQGISLISGTTFSFLLTEKFVFKSIKN